MVTPVEGDLAKEEPLSSIAEWSDFVGSLNLSPPPQDWKFDREEANQRGNG